MKTPGKLLSGLTILAFCAALASPAAAQDISSTIRAEITPLQDSLRNQPIADPDRKK